MTAAPSGIPSVDCQWGGFAQGSAYLLVGSAGAGRSVLALQAARAAVDSGDRCLLISPRTPEALGEIGRSADLDLAQAHGTGRLRLLRIPAPADLAARGAEGLAQAYRDLVGLVQADRPDRLVVEDFTPLVQFDTFDRFHEAFSGLVNALHEAGVMLVLGLGDPANDASRRLLRVVEELVAGTVRLDDDGELTLTAPPAQDVEGEAAEAVAPPVAPPPADEALEQPVSEQPTSEQPAPGQSAHEHSTSEPYSGNDGASAPVAEPVPTGSAASAVVPAGGPPPTEIVPAPPVAFDLLHSTEDLFGADPAAAIMEQGFLADSGLIPAPLAAVAHPPAPAFRPEAVEPLDDAAWPDEAADVASTPAAPPADEFAEPDVEPAPAPAPLPPFAPLGQSEAPLDPAVAFRQSLQAAFDAPASFLVVAVRMDPAAPEAHHFGAVHDGLRSALREDDRLLVNAERKRAITVLPASGAEASQALFSGLQDHLRSVLGDQAGAVLAAVGAVTIPDGQPFTSAADLLTYAFEG